MLNVHPSLLPRWRGAAPIERAIMAGDERTGVCVMRLTAGLDSGPVALRAEVPIGADEDFEALSSTLAELGGELLVRALDLEAEGRLEFAEQDEAAVTYAEKIDPAERRLDPGRPARGAGGDRPRPHPARRRLPGDRRRRAARRPPRPRRRRQRQDRRRQVGVGGAAGRLLPRRPAAGGGAAPGRQADAGRRLPARPLAAEAAVSAAIAPARALAFATIRETFERRRLHRARLPRRRRAARPRGARARPGAAARLRRGAAPRHRRRGDRTPRRPLDPAARPARPRRRCASASTSCSSPTAPPTTPPSTRRSSWSRGPAPPTPPASSTRCCAGPPASAPR